MRFDDRTLWGRDDEMDEYSDSGAYGESLEEDLEEEEEEEEESGVMEDRPGSESEPVMEAPAPPPPPKDDEEEETPTEEHAHQNGETRAETSSDEKEEGSGVENEESITMPQNMPEEKVALVTAAGRGMGAAIARLLLIGGISRMRGINSDDQSSAAKSSVIRALDYVGVEFVSWHR